MTAGLTMLVAAPLLMAQGQATVQPEEGFPWGIHLITIPLVLAFGILVGWSLRERKAQADEARRTAASGQKPSV